MERPHDDPPWSIPIREAGPDVPHRTATWIDRVPLPPVVLGVLALFVCVVAALVVLDGDPAESGPEVLGAGVSAETTVEPATSVAPTTTAPTTTAAPTTAEAVTTTADDASDRSVERPRGTARAVDPEPDGLPIHTPGDLGGGWVAQVSSVPSSAGGAALSRSYETVRRDVPDALIVRGSEWASLRDGFWVIFHPGYDDAPSAVAACEGWGFEGRDDCFARYLSVDDATQRTCWRDESGSLAGDCD